MSFQMCIGNAYFVVSINAIWLHVTILSSPICVITGVHFYENLVSDLEALFQLTVTTDQLIITQYIFASNVSVEQTISSR